MTSHRHRLQHPDRHLHPRPRAQPPRLRRPPRDGHQGARRLQRLRGHRHLDGAQPGQLDASRVAAKVASIDTRNEQRDGHLRTNDFLDAEQFPEITFASTSIAHDGGDDFQVTGDLTIKGVTKSVTFPLEFQGSAKDPFGNDRIGFEGSTQIVRSDFGVSFNAALETGGVLVSDKITLELEISAIKSA